LTLAAGRPYNPWRPYQRGDLWCREIEISDKGSGDGSPEHQDQLK